MSTFFDDTIKRLIELNRLEDRMRELKASREKTSDVTALMESLRANISVTVLLNHDRLRARGKWSVAEVRNGVCCGCHMAVATGNLHQLRHRQQLQKCESCGRYSYLLEESGAGSRSSEDASLGEVHTSRKRDVDV